MPGKHSTTTCTLSLLITFLQEGVGGGCHKATSRKAVHMAHSTDKSHRSQPNSDSRSRQLTCEDATEIRLEQSQEELSGYQHAKEMASLLLSSSHSKSKLLINHTSGSGLPNTKSMHKRMPFLLL